jgi:tetratricopeptide (TPR) repeat protein
MRGCSPPSVVKAALAALQAGRPSEAERLAREALKPNPGGIRAAQVLGQALLMQDRPGEAIAPLRRAARLGEDPAIDILLARALAGVGKGEAALDQLRLATTRRPPFAPAFLELAGHLRRIGRPDEAIAAFEGGLALVPGAPVFLIGLGYLRLEAGDRVAARDLFGRAHATAPERRDALLALATVTAADGDPAAAADLYRQAVRARPDDGVTRINLARCLLELGEREAGEESLRVASRGDPRLAGMAISALADSAHGRLFLRPSAAAAFLGVEKT